MVNTDLILKSQSLKRADVCSHLFQETSQAELYCPLLSQECSTTEAPEQGILRESLKDQGGRRLLSQRVANC